MASLGWNIGIRPYNDENASGKAADISSAVNSGAHILNCSWHTINIDPNDNTKYINYNYPSISSAISNAITSGRIVVASAGNPPGSVLFSDGVTRTPSEYPPYTAYPAAYNGVIAVSATNSSDGFPSGYNYGGIVDVSAPGIDIFTTNADGTYSSHSGTSFSAPLVSALAGLIWSKNSSLSATQVANTINASTDDLGSTGWDNYFGYGRINANKALHNLYVPQVFSTIQSAINAATSGQTVYVSGTQTLSGNISVPSGVTLTIKSGATVNLVNGSNYYSIISTGGTITKQSGATINGLRAELQVNTVLKGLCGSIQTAATNAGNNSEIVLQNGNFNENVSISNKDDITISGGSSDYSHFGTLTLTNCDYFYGYNFGTKSVYVNNSSYALINNVDAYGTSQSTRAYYFYNSDAGANYVLAYNSQAGISCYDGAEAEIDDSWLYNNLRGVESFNGSSVDVDNTYFCGTNLDLQAYNFSSINASLCYYDGGTPSISQSSSTVYTSGNQSCSSSRANSGGKSVDDKYSISTDKGVTGDSEFQKINSFYFSVNRKLVNALKEKTAINKEEFCADYEKVIKDF